MEESEKSLVLLFDVEEDADLKSVSQAVKKTYRANLEIVVKPDSGQSVQPQLPNTKTQNIDVEEGDCATTEPVATKKLNSPLKRVLAKKDKMKSTKSHSERETQEDTTSVDSGIGVTDLDTSTSCTFQNTTGTAPKQRLQNTSYKTQNPNHKRKAADNARDTNIPSKRQKPANQVDTSRIVAMDCEFVGVGSNKISALGMSYK